MELTDSRWQGLNGAYRTVFDPRDAIRQLEAGQTSEAWDTLWEELHHQGAVDLASYAAVPQLVRIHRERQLGAWQTYAMVTTIELASRAARNPPIPEWLQDEYRQALGDLARLGLQELPAAQDAAYVSSILAFLALWKDARTYARLLLLCSDAELAVVENDLVNRALEGPKGAG
jgi:hypothetical protein